MPAAIALASQIIAALPSITMGVSDLIRWIRGVRTAAQQSGEWTPEIETAFVNALIARATAPEQQPDPK